MRAKHTRPTHRPDLAQEDRADVLWTPEEWRVLHRSLEAAPDPAKVCGEFMGAVESRARHRWAGLLRSHREALRGRRLGDVSLGTSRDPRPPDAASLAEIERQAADALADLADRWHSALQRLGAIVERPCRRAPTTHGRRGA